MSGSPTPGISDLCLAGEAAFEMDEYELAVEWYELACTGTIPNGAYGPVPPGLTERRFERLAELRMMVPWRKVQRLSVADRGHVLAVQTVTAKHRRSAIDLRPLVKWPGARFLGVDGIEDSPLRGQAQTFFDILRRATRVHGFTALTLLEDDVVLAKNALDYIATTKIGDDLAFISWFSTEACTIPRVPPVLSCFKARDYQFNQAITFPARTVHKLLASDALKNWSERHGADRIYKDVFPDQYVAVHYPNLVQHTGGTESLVGNNNHGLRTSPSFPGEGFDALTLVR